MIKTWNCENGAASLTDDAGVRHRDDGRVDDFCRAPQAQRRLIGVQRAARLLKNFPMGSKQSFSTEVWKWCTLQKQCKSRLCA